MSYSNTTITSRGYSVTLPTGMVSAFLSLSHDDQVEVAEALNVLDGIDASPDDMLIETMAQELDQQDHAIELFLAERVDLKSQVVWISGLNDCMKDEITAKRLEIEGLVERVNYDGTELAAAYAEITNLNDILLRSARYVGQVRELLGKVGITVETENATGKPVMVIERDRFIAAAAVVDEA